MSINPNPILRTGSVLRAQDSVGLTPVQTVKLGRALYDNADELHDIFKRDAIGAIKGLKWIETPIKDIAPPRLRFSPNLTMDMKSARFLWDDFVLETRAVMTICPGDTRGKLWVRLGFVENRDLNSPIPEIKDKLFLASGPLKSIWLKIYNDACRKIANKSFVSTYEINVFMLSSDGVRGNIRSLLSDYSLAAENGELTRAVAFKALKSEFSNVAGLEIEDGKYSENHQKIVAYSFPKYESINLPNYKNNVEVMSDRDLKAICAINIKDRTTDVFGVGIDQEPPSDYRRSASFIASAEISYELGHLF